MALTKQAFALGAVVVAVVAGLVTATMLTNRINDLEAQNVEMRQKLEQVDAAKDELAKTAMDSEQRQSKAVAKLEAALNAIGKPPSPQDMAKAVLAGEGSKELVKNIANALANDPLAANALRGKDADPAEVAKSLGGSNPILIEGVAQSIWETRRQDILSNQELIATVAARVHDEYGAELMSAADAEKQALIIARELAKEPAFAALVAATKE